VDSADLVSLPRRSLPTSQSSQNGWSTPPHPADTPHIVEKWRPNSA